MSRKLVLLRLLDKDKIYPEDSDPWRVKMVLSDNEEADKARVYVAISVRAAGNMQNPRALELEALSIVRNFILEHIREIDRTSTLYT
jgi:hypothetical protein